MTTTSSRPTRRKTPASASTTTTAPKREPASDPSPEQDTRAGTSIPVLVPELHLHRVPLPRVGGATMPTVHVPGPSAIRDHLPEPKRVAWFGGLAGLAAFGVINWPVAGVVAVGSYLAEHRAKDAIREELAAATSPDEDTEA